MGIEKVVMEAIEKLILTPVTARLFSNEIKAVLEERIRKYKDEGC